MWVRRSGANGPPEQRASHRTPPEARQLADAGRPALIRAARRTTSGSRPIQLTATVLHGRRRNNGPAQPLEVSLIHYTWALIDLFPDAQLLLANAQRLAPFWAELGYSSVYFVALEWAFSKHERCTDRNNKEWTHRILNGFR